MQREGLGTCDSSELYFETEHRCTGKSAAGSVNRAEHSSSASSCLQPPFTAEEQTRSESESRVSPALAVVTRMVAAVARDARGIQGRGSAAAAMTANEAEAQA